MSSFPFHLAFYLLWFLRKGGAWMTEEPVQHTYNPDTPNVLLRKQ